MAELTDRCLNVAMLERGPTQLNIPRDMFYGEVDVSIPAPKTIEMAAGGRDALLQAAELINKAWNPVILAGERYPY
jgi:sulfoacetaldehyde acetyltransferase